MVNTPEIRNITEETHNSLRRAVANALDKKKKLGHYKVQWQNNQILIDGADAPKTTEACLNK